MSVPMECRGDGCRRQAMPHWAYCHDCAADLLFRAWSTNSDPLPQLLPADVPPGLTELDMVDLERYTRDRSITEPSPRPRTESTLRFARGDR